MIDEFPFSLFEFSTYIFVLLAIWIVYVRYKEGYYTKTNDDKSVDSGKKLSKFQRWWKESFIRKIYVVRAGQRPFLCFFPWAGVAFSLLGILFYIVGTYDKRRDRKNAESTYNCLGTRRKRYFGLW